MDPSCARPSLVRWASLVRGPHKTNAARSGCFGRTPQCGPLVLAARSTVRTTRPLLRPGTVRKEDRRRRGAGLGLIDNPGDQSRRMEFRAVVRRLAIWKRDLYPG